MGDMSSWARMVPRLLEPDKSKAYIVTGKVWVNNHAHILSSRIDVDYLCFYLNSVDYAPVVTGTTRLKLNQRAMRKIAVAFPALNEQRRIVAKIEELFSELDKGVESLKTARAQLKTYRQSLLKAAFEGRLTEQWRRENADQLETTDQLLQRIQVEREARYQQQLDDWKATVAEWESDGRTGKKPRKPGKPVAALPNVPQEWSAPGTWLCLPIGWLLSVRKKGMTTGPFGTMLKKTDHREDGVPVLGVENIGEGRFQPGVKIHVEPRKAGDLAAFEVETGDVLVSRSGTVGEVCRVPDGIGHALISTNLMRISLDEAVIDSQYFVLLFQGGSPVKDQVRNLCKGSTRAFLNQTILASMAFPVPTLDEQKALLDVVQERLSQVDELETTIDRAFQRLEDLRQSILKRAFEGKLVPQDPDDEPASTLLERIRQEQADVPTPKRRNRKTKASA